MSYVLTCTWPDGQRPDCAPRKYDTLLQAQGAAHNLNRWWQRPAQAPNFEKWPLITITEETDAANTQ